VKTCQHLEPLERAIEDAIQASIGRFEAQGFSFRGPDPLAWGSPGPEWRCYSCGGGRAESYLDSVALWARLHFCSPPIQYEEFPDPPSKAVLVRFGCQECRCVILGVQVPDEARGSDDWQPWSLIIA
jgi:hypothetical protein